MSGGRIPTQYAKDQISCEVEGTLKGGHCEERAEVMLDGLHLCERHAQQLEAQDKVDLLRGIISCLELCLSNLALRRDTNLIRLLRAKRAGAAAEMELAYEELRRAATM
jgi:hypothetical protein